MGQTVGAYDDDAQQAHRLGAVQWAAGMVRGGCKATITSNYTHTRLTPSNPTIPAQPVSETTVNFNPYMGEIDALAMAEDGRVFYAGRAVCFQGQQQFTQLDASDHRPRLRPDPRLRPARRRARSTRTRRGSPRSPTSRCSAPRAAAPRPARRPRPSTASSASPWTRSSRTGRDRIHLRRLPPVLRRRDGPQHGHEHGPGLRPRRLHGRAPPLALHLQRDDQDAHAGSSGSSTAS